VKPVLFTGHHMLQPWGRSTEHTDTTECIWVPAGASRSVYHPAMSARARSAVGQLIVMAVVWIVVRWLFDLMLPGGRESWAQLVLTGLVFGVFMAGWEWWRWPRRTRSRDG
jgi:hypothetical protein